MPAARCLRMLIASSKGGDMYHSMDGWGWFLITFVSVFWIAVFGVALYAAAWLASRAPAARRAIRQSVEPSSGGARR